MAHRPSPTPKPRPGSNDRRPPKNPNQLPSDSPYKKTSRLRSEIPPVTTPLVSPGQWRIGFLPGRDERRDLQPPAKPPLSHTLFSPPKTELPPEFKIIPRKYFEEPTDHKPSPPDVRDSPDPTVTRQDKLRRERARLRYMNKAPDPSHLGKNIDPNHRWPNTTHPFFVHRMMGKVVVVPQPSPDQPTYPWAKDKKQMPDIENNNRTVDLDPHSDPGRDPHRPPSSVHAPIITHTESNPDLQEKVEFRALPVADPEHVEPLASISKIQELLLVVGSRYSSNDPSTQESMIRVEPKREQSPEVEVTPEKLMVFFQELEKCGQNHEAARRAKLKYTSVKALQKTIPEIKEFYELALDRYREVLHMEAHRRAVNGWEEPVFGGRFKDEIVGYVTRYDSRLMELLLKRHIPEFREKFEGGITVHAGVLVVPGATLNAAEWAQQHGGSVGPSIPAGPAQPALAAGEELDIVDEPPPKQ